MSSSSRPPILTRRTAVRLGTGGLAAALVAPGRRSAQAADAATLEANKTIVRRLFAEAVNGGNEAVIAELYIPEFVGPHHARHLPRPAGMPLPIDEFHTVFPDVYVTVEDAVAEGDLVATRVTWRGTHPPAGTHVEGRTMHLFRIVKGQISEQWSTGWEWRAQCGYRSVPQPTNPLAGP